MLWKESKKSMKMILLKLIFHRNWKKLKMNLLVKNKFLCVKHKKKKKLSLQIRKMMSTDTKVKFLVVSQFYLHLHLNPLPLKTHPTHLAHKHPLLINSGNS